MKKEKVRFFFLNTQPFYFVTLEEKITRKDASAYLSKVKRQRAEINIYDEDWNFF